MKKVLQKLAVSGMALTVIFGAAACGDQKTAKRSEVQEENTADEQAETDVEEEKDDAEEETVADSSQTAEQEQTATDSTAAETPAEAPAADPNQVTPELKELLDEYEAYIDQYCDFMQRYAQNPTDMQLISQYAQMMTSLSDWEEKVNAYDAANKSTMSTADANYYIEVTARCSQKLLSASASMQ